jgi:hypothetical protein
MRTKLSEIRASLVRVLHHREGFPKVERYTYM